MSIVSVDANMNRGQHRAFRITKCNRTSRTDGPREFLRHIENNGDRHNAPSARRTATGITSGTWKIRKAPADPAWAMQRSSGLRYGETFHPGLILIRR